MTSRGLLLEQACGSPGSQSGSNTSPKIQNTLGKDQGLIKCSQPVRARSGGLENPGALEMLSREEHDHTGLLRDSQLTRRGR